MKNENIETVKRKQKYITYNRINGKRIQQTTSDFELAVDRCECGGYVVLKFRNQKLMMYDKRKKM